tara:strand:+ start:777 stop:1325 length:549 start_codon:yes stop_codon:yes gene_type:complete
MHKVVIKKINNQVKSFVAKRSAVTAVEFALVGLPFTILMVGLLELGLAFGAASLLEGGTSDAARMIRTGQVQDAGDPEVAFRDALCGHVDALIPCGDIIYEVITLPNQDFTETPNFPPNYDVDGNLNGGGFDPGAENDVVLIRSFYRYPFVTLQLGSLMSPNGTNSMPMQTTRVIRNEPYRF